MFSYYSCQSNFKLFRTRCKIMHLKLFLVIFVMIASFRGYDFDCNEDDLEGHFMEIMFFGSDKAIVPANDDEMGQHCSVVRNGINGIKTYANDCLKGFPKNVMVILMNSMKSHMQKRCDNPKDRAEFIEYVSCLLPKDQKMGPLNICSEKHTKMIQLAVDMGEDSHVHGTCCAYYFFRHCVLDHIKSVCGEGHKQFWDEIFDDVGNEAVTFACEGYDSKDKCIKDFKPEHLSKLQAIDQATDPAVWHHDHKTPMYFTLEMFKKYY